MAWAVSISSDCSVCGAAAGAAGSRRRAVLPFDAQFQVLAHQLIVHPQPLVDALDRDVLRRVGLVLALRHVEAGHVVVLKDVVLEAARRADDDVRVSPERGALAP